MKAVQLNTPRADNGGSFRDAGSTIDIGDDADQIVADTAKEWTDAGLAVDVQLIQKQSGGQVADAIVDPKGKPGK
ncbi:MAG: hypothetical protein J0H88_08415 [Sphingomonadales bacterium]|nr:hypothetical protein [Sphingomonadales bacterium]